jgi:hypothetical protein
MAIWEAAHSLKVALSRGRDHARTLRRSARVGKKNESL